MDFALAASLLGDSSVLLMSPWKPLILWGVFIAWAWLVATKIDKDDVSCYPCYRGSAIAFGNETPFTQQFDPL